MISQMVYSEYFNDPTAYAPLDLVKSGELKLHWANWDKLLGHLKKRASKGHEVSAFDVIGRDLEMYKNFPVWIFSKQGKIKTNIYELYRYYMDPRLRELWFTINDETLISFKSTNGPCIRLQSLRWVDSEIYKKFAYLNLLSNESMTNRKFRINVEIPLNCQFVNSVRDNVELVIVQISKAGLLMKLEKYSDLIRIQAEENIELTGDFSTFEKACGSNFEQMNDIFSSGVFDNGKKNTRSTFSPRGDIFDLGSNGRNLSYSNGQEFFIFLKFNDLQELTNSKSISSVIRVVERFEEAAKEQLIL